MDNVLMNILLKRRSVRKYKNEKIPREQLEMILNAGLISPSGRNRRPWEFIVVEDKEVLASLAKARDHGASMLEGAGAAIVVFADPELTDVWTEDCCIVMSNMHMMAAALGVGSCWIQGRLRVSADGRKSVCRRYLVRRLLRTHGFPRRQRQGYGGFSAAAAAPGPAVRNLSGTRGITHERAFDLFGYDPAGAEERHPAFWHA